MAHTRVNTDQGYDGVIVVLLLLEVWRKGAQLLAGVWQHFAEELFGLHGAPESSTGFLSFVAVVVLVLLLLQRGLMCRILGAGTYDVARAGFMAVAGALVVCVSVWIVALAPAVIAQLLLGNRVPQFLGECGLWVFGLLGYCLAGGWAGWRFGKWGYFWGAAAAAAIGVCIFRGLFFIVPSLGVVVWLAGAVTAAVIGGRLGAARFQRTLKGAPASGG